MNRFVRRKATLALSLAAALAPLSDVRAQQTAPADRCEGTFCDLYYGGSPAEPQQGQKPAPAKPLTVPSGGVLGFFSGGNAAQQPGASGTPAKRPLVGLGGGGLASMARGDAPERCSGTFCDFYYGGPPPEKQATQPSHSDQQAATDTAPNAELTPAQPGVRYRPLPTEKPGCAAKAQDPWSCYR